MIRRLSRTYGAHPAHLAGHLLFLALAVWAIGSMLDMREARNWVLWFVAAVILHDLVALPLYSALDRVAARGLGLARLPVPALNHLRVPVVVSGTLLLVGFPLILDRAPGNYARVAGTQPEGYLGAWLAITAGVFLLSAAVYAVRVLRGRQRHELQDPVAGGDEGSVRAG
jgi:hypothetical protein